MWSLHLPYVIVQSTTTSLAVNCHVIQSVNSRYRHVIACVVVGTSNQKMQEIFHKFFKKHYNSTVTPKITKKKKKRWKGLDKIFPSIPNLHKKMDTKKTKTKIYVRFFSLFFSKNILTHKEHHTDSDTNVRFTRVCSGNKLYLLVEAHNSVSSMLQARIRFTPFNFFFSTAKSFMQSVLKVWRLIG